MTTVMDRLAWLLVVMITGQALLHGRGGAVLGDGLISFDFPDFSNSSSLPINFLYSATATPDGQGISLCLNSQPGTSAGMMWYSLPIQVRGFSMTFNYTVSDFSKSSQRRDGMAFVIQTEGPNAFGPGGAGLGYGDTNDGDGKGITKSVAIEFDSFYDPTLLDPYSFHISVHTNQNLGANSANESYSVWMTEQPGITLSTQVITINYVPWPTVRGLGLMSVVYNGFNLGSFNLTLDKLVALDAVEGSAYVGFTGSHSPSNGTFPGETITINSWSFAFSGKIQASSCLIFGLDYAEAGAGLVFYLQAVDNFGYNMTTDSISASGLTPLVTLTEPNSALQNGTITYSSMGLYKLFVNATVSGNATVNVFLGNQRIGPGAYSLSVFPTVPNPATTYSYGVAPQATAGSIGSFWVQLRDVYNNNVTTNASVPTVLITSTDFSQPATVTFDPTGRYLVEYNVTLSGAFAIGVALNGSPTSDPSYPLQVIPAALDPATSLAYGMSLTVVAGTLQTVFVQLRDVFGNNVTDATANVTLSIVLDAIEVFGTRTDLGGGLNSFTYNATTMGTYNLVPLVNGVPLSQLTGYYTPITVAPASVNPAVSYAYGAGLTQGTAGYLAVLYVQLTDTFGNNVSVPNIQVRAELVDYPDVQPSTTPVGTNAGLFMISYNVTVASTYTLQVQAQGTIVTYGSSTVTIQPAEVDPVSCVAFGTGLTGADLVVGNLNAFSVQLRDRYLNNITTPEAPLDVVITDLLSSSAVNVTPIFESGAYQVSYNITLASDYQVSLTVSGDPILNPITNLTLAPGAINPPTCVATGDLGTDAVAGTLRVFQVQLRDVYSNNIVTVDPSTTIVTAQFTNPNLAVPIAITYTEAGIYSCSYNATVTGSYTLDILVLGAAIANGNTPVQVVAAPAYPPYCMAQGQALTVATAGALVSFSIYLYDVFNNSIPPNILAPVVSVTTPTEQTVDVTPDETQGIYTATYNITQSATYTVDITIGGVQIGTPPASLVINPAPLYVPNCIASGSTLTGTAGTQGAITLLQRDVFGNNIKDYTQVTGVTFEMTLGSDPTIKANTSQPDQLGDGSYALSYDITLAGNYVTGISINNVNILGSPFTTVVNPANFDPHGTATVGLETNVVAGNNNSFSVQLRDVYGNDITENVVAPDNITLLLNGAEVENTEITLVGDGIYDIVYNQTVAGTYTMNITIDHVEIGTTPLPQIIITPAGTYPPNCYAVGEATLKAYIKRDNSYILVVRDQFYNHCNGSTIPPVIQLTATGEQTVVGSAVLNPDGNYTITYSGITAKATYTMSVTFNGEHISGSPFAVESQYSNSAPNTVMIVGIVLGCVAFVGIAAFFGYRMYKKRHGGYEYLA